MGKILISGGCGFLGYYLVNEIKRHFPSSAIKILDLHENPIGSFRINDKKIELSLGKDITDFNSIRGEFKDADTFIHCAGMVSFSLKDRENLFKINVEGTKNALKAAYENNVKKFIHISSVAALGYKDSESDLAGEKFSFNWRLAEKRKKYYMITKHLADIEVEKYKQKMNVGILYPGLMLGPGDLKNSARLIQAIKQKRIPFNMPGGTNIIDVRDVARGILLAMKKHTAGNYLLGGHNISYVELNKIIAEVVGEQPPSKTFPKFLNPLLYFVMLNAERIKPNFELAADNLDSSFKFRYYDNSKAKKELGWNPRISLKQTISDTYGWMIKERL